MRVAALDLGTNTFLCLIVDVENGQMLRVHSDQSVVVRLGQGVAQTQSLHPQALQRAGECLAVFRQTIDQHQVKRVAAVATSAARDAKNRQEFFALTEKHQIPVEIISGAREAELTYRGALFDRAEPAQSAVIDVGGGSTEIITRHEGKFRGESLQVGSVRLTEKFISRHPVALSELRALQAEIHGHVQELARRNPHAFANITEWVAVAGTPTSLAMMTLQSDFVENKIHGFRLTRAQLAQWVQTLAGQTVEERCRLKGLDPGRADVIVAGAAILLGAMDVFAIKELVVSTKGVRYGLALSMAD